MQSQELALTSGTGQLGPRSLINPSTASILFRKLGHFTLDDNSRFNNQKSRELKTVYIDVTAQYIKLVLNRNHKNHENPFNQVGLMRVNLIGTSLSENEAHLLKSPSNQFLN